jgi:anti-sigma regulatory factor (Ser/Thr protein kinase)
MAGLSAAATTVAQFSFPAGAASVTRARHAVGEYVESLAIDRDDVEAFVSEAVANAVIHAFRGRKPGTIWLEISTAEGRLLISIIDDGIGIRPSPRRRGLGFGLALMASLAEAVTLQRIKPSGTRIEGLFELGALPPVTPLRRDVL